MAIVSALPVGLLAQAFERNQLAGPPLPYRFVPECGTDGKEDKKLEKKDLVKIKFSATVKKSYKVFHDGTPEDAINLINIHVTIVQDMKLKQQVATLRALQEQSRDHCTKRGSSG